MTQLTGNFLSLKSQLESGVERLFSQIWNGEATEGGVGQTGKVFDKIYPDILRLKRTLAEEGRDYRVVMEALVLAIKYKALSTIFELETKIENLSAMTILTTAEMNDFEGSMKNKKMELDIVLRSEYLDSGDEVVQVLQKMQKELVKKIKNQTNQINDSDLQATSVLEIK